MGFENLSCDDGSCCSQPYVSGSFLNVQWHLEGQLVGMRLGIELKYRVPDVD